MDAEFPAKLQFLFEPHPYKIVFGGRDGVKSWSLARALLIIGAQYKLRFLCARETQQSIAESVHHLLKEQIAALNLGHLYRVEQARIVGIKPHAAGPYGRKLAEPGCSEFVFAGLRHNVNQIKSFEALDGVWVEEAANVSKNSWEVVIPTIRKEGSEIWVSFNPELATDDTYVRWVTNPPPGAVVVRTSYRDNVWLSETSRQKIEHLKATDPDAFNNIYDGATKNTVAGAIYANEFRVAEQDHRITRVPYEATKPVHTFWDLGYGDKTSIWLIQIFPFEYRIIDFIEGERQPLIHYLKALQAKPYLYGTDYLPHDARAHSLGTGRSIEEMMRAGGRKVQIVPRLSITDGIEAVRAIFHQCWFDGTKCADGIQALRHYRYGEIEKLGTKTREPLHDWSSHAADAFRTFAVGTKQPKPVTKPTPLVPRNYSERSWMA